MGFLIVTVLHDSGVACPRNNCSETLTHKVLKDSSTDELKHRLSCPDNILHNIGPDSRDPLLTSMKCCSDVKPS